MAEEVSGPAPADLAGAQYDFDKWLNGSWWKLTQGVDFQVPLERMRIYCFGIARRRGFKLTTKASGNELWIMALPGDYQPREQVSPGEVVSQASVGSTKRGRMSKYPDEIWDGKPRAFYPGKDFQEGCQEGFRQAIRAAATYRKIGVKTSCRKDGAVIVQAIKPTI